MGAVFSVPLFFITFRETLEASIIISVLLSLVENLVDRSEDASQESSLVAVGDGEESRAQRKKRLVRRMRIQIWAGAGVGLLIAFAIGAAFIAVFFTTLSDIWAKSEEIWEGTFSLIACIIIFVMGLTMLRIDRSKIRWRAKLEGAFDKQAEDKLAPLAKKEAKGGKWTLFLIPLITVLREGLEAVVFVGGVSLGQPAKAIPLAAITGIISGLIVGYLIYISSSRVSLSIFLVVSTNVLFLLGAGLFSKAVGDFERYQYAQIVGAAVAESGAGPGSFNTAINIWHLNYGIPSESGWSIFNAVLGWDNNGTYGTVFAYIVYWLAVIASLMYMKWSEGRVKLFGRHSPAGQRRADRAELAGPGNYSDKDVKDNEILTQRPDGEASISDASDGIQEEDVNDKKLQGQAEGSLGVATLEK